ncbi:PREDICTED: transcriptional repressor CTCFL-like [Nanorana parkeri]|uniref:transcriptional repressor CTCFL-like n=1 Tax=Nanorana parkeri TaxID=125878 RepID=UPI000853FA6A|nr:PREDICTED: transcriptional repressor CTCFL-like [Nanorana parkeri]
MEAHGEGILSKDLQTEVICVADPGRSEAELAFQVYKMLDGNEAFSNVSEYHMVPVQAADGSIVGVQVTGIQRGADGDVGGDSILPMQLIEFHNVEEAEQPQAEQPLPEPSVTSAEPPVADPGLSEAAQELEDGHDNSQICAAAPEETSEQEEPTPQPAAGVEKKELKTLYRCGQCQFSSLMLSTMRRHLRRHSNEHICSVCKKAFPNARELRLHVSAHMGIRPHKCKDCDMTYRTASDLLRHTRSAHTLEKPFKCCYCDYSSVEANRMKIHIRSHTGERPFMCGECSFATTDAFKLRRHMRTHTGEKPYNCHVCQARFTQNASLKMHMLRKHTENVQKERCLICNAVLFGKNDVKVHIRKQHTYLEDPIKCRLCSEEFHERYLYRQHLESHRSRKTLELKSGKQSFEAYELDEQEAEISTTEDGVSWNIMPSAGEAQLFLNYQEGEQPHAVTELHSIPMQTADGSIVQAIVLQSGEQVDAEAMHAEVYEVRDLAQVLQPLVEQQSSEPIVLALDSVNQDAQSAEQLVRKRENQRLF